jgi:hypothetical protein
MNPPHGEKTRCGYSRCATEYAATENPDAPQDQKMALTHYRHYYPPIKNKKFKKKLGKMSPSIGLGAFL